MPFKPALTIQGLFEFCVSFCRSTKSFGIGSERRARPTKVEELTIRRLSSHSPAVESHLPIHHVCHVAALAQAALLKKFGKSDVYDFLRKSEIDFRRGPILQIIAQLLVRSWDNGWDNR